MCMHRHTNTHTHNEMHNESPVHVAGGYVTIFLCKRQKLIMEDSASLGVLQHRHVIIRGFLQIAGAL